MQGFLLGQGARTGRQGLIELSAGEDERRAGDQLRSVQQAEREGQSVVAREYWSQRELKVSVRDDYHSRVVQKSPSDLSDSFPRLDLIIPASPDLLRRIDGVPMRIPDRQIVAKRSQDRLLIGQDFGAQFLKLGQVGLRRRDAVDSEPALVAGRFEEELDERLDRARFFFGFAREEKGSDSGSLGSRRVTSQLCAFDPHVGIGPCSLLGRTAASSLACRSDARRSPLC